MRKKRKKNKQDHLRERKKKEAQFELLAGITLNKAYRLLMRRLIRAYFDAVKKNNCARCGKEISLTDDFHIDHLECYWNSDSPLKTYLNIDNISISHPSCNIKAGTIKRADLQKL